MNNIQVFVEIIKYVVIAVIAGAVGYFVRRTIAEAKISSAEAEAERIITEAKKDAETKKREALVEAKDEIYKMRSDMERENRERRVELQDLERRLVQKRKASTARVKLSSAKRV